MSHNPSVYAEPSGLVVERIALGEYEVHGDNEVLCEVYFQNGPIPVNGVNGVTIESLLAISKDRLEELNGKFSCEENEIALDAISAALAALHSRTAKRIARGVEGKEVK
ncbi:hypothetical protein KNT64_gp143 [Pseudomonas phage PspYZU05]|uniref:Acb2/Tad1 hairpin domain-containing protein n=1 Tax=Pseudomonas phage PspYZU05 TaxID=1983556 RepID=A0A2U7N2M9_9CAUD|nr:hypothetical protein KNT64_gp143 [Pseudomonas phage PspYZU05]ASD52095.1 hypothetical protein PspYZU05_143 [Pseudomonas phage PspYZU05]